MYWYTMDKANPKGKRARGWCFTANNPNDDAYRDIYDALECVYLIVGGELSSTGTPHHQGYVYFKNAVRFETVKTKLPEGSHIEWARGTPEENEMYCGKETIFYKKGVLPVKGKRKDIDHVREMLGEGKRMADICDEAGSYQAIRCAELILKYKEPSRNWLPEVLWFWGPTGSGKTRTAFELAPGAWVSGKNLKWWDAYDAHEDVIIDDFRGDFCTFHELLRILDRYPYRVECKGGSRQLLAKRIIITAPFPPERAYRTLEATGQLLRRISEIREFPEADTQAGT